MRSFRSAGLLLALNRKACRTAGYSRITAAVIGL